MPSMFKRFRNRGQSDSWPLQQDEFAGPAATKETQKPMDREDMRTPTLDGPMLDGGYLDGPSKKDREKRLDGAMKTEDTQRGRTYNAPDDIGTISSQSAASPPPAIRGGNGGGMRSPVQPNIAENFGKFNKSSAMQYQVSNDSGHASAASSASTASPAKTAIREAPTQTRNPPTSQRGSPVEQRNGSSEVRTSEPFSHSHSNSAAESRNAVRYEQPRKFHHPVNSDDGQGMLDEFDGPAQARSPQAYNHSQSNSAVSNRSPQAYRDGNSAVNNRNALHHESSRKFHHPVNSDDGKEQLDEFDAPNEPAEVPAAALQRKAYQDTRIGNAIQDRVAVVTGCSSGIGLASCIALLEQDWCVLGVDIQPAPKELDESQIFHFFQIDVTSAEAPKFIFESAKDRFNGRIDALVNCAGVVDTLKCVDTLDMDEWRWVMETNLTAPVRLMGAMVKIFEEQKHGGSIVNIGSYACMSGGVAGVAHTASKHGLVGVTKNTAFRFKKSNFRCNILCPGAVRSNIRESIDPAQTDFEAAEVFKTVREAAHPDDLRLQPEQVAAAIVYLASDASKGINGAVIPIDNGWSTI